MRGLLAQWLKQGDPNRDAILDFSKGDKIDLSTIDASDGTAGDQAFSFIGTDRPPTVSPREVSVRFSALAPACASSKNSS